MSLADALAVSRAARNLVLVGDPRQLAQPLQGSHPPGVGVSALDHLLGGNVTIAPDRGVLLDLTWRMHPDVTAFVSRSFYEGRLGSEPQCARQAVLDRRSGDDGSPRTSFVEHAGDRVRSDEEAERVREIIEQLTRATWRLGPGDERPMTLDDIVVVAPYNAQVACLVEALPAGARVGTVDRFQGQEAAVSIFSMATSSVEDLPRNLEFLFSLNRLNVAVSRARGAVDPGVLARVAPCTLPHAGADAARQRALPVRGDGRTVDVAPAARRAMLRGMTEAIAAGPPLQSLDGRAGARGRAARAAATTHPPSRTAVGPQRTTSRTSTPGVNTRCARSMRRSRGPVRRARRRQPTRRTKCRDLRGASRRRCADQVRDASAAESYAALIDAVAACYRRRICCRERPDNGGRRVARCSGQRPWLMSRSTSRTGQSEHGDRGGRGGGGEVEPIALETRAVPRQLRPVADYNFACFYARNGKADEALPLLRTALPKPPTCARSRSRTSGHRADSRRPRVESLLGP